MPETVPVLTTPALPVNTYTSRPVSIEAVQWDGTIENGRLIIDWADGAEMRWSNETPQRLTIQTLEGRMSANPTDWIIKGTEGEFYPCKDSVFRAKYRDGGEDTSNQIIPPELRRQLERSFDGPINVAPRSLDMSTTGDSEDGVEIRNIVLVTKAEQ